MATKNVSSGSVRPAGAARRTRRRPPRRGAGPARSERALRAAPQKIAERGSPSVRWRSAQRFARARAVRASRSAAVRSRRRVGSRSQSRTSSSWPSMLDHRLAAAAQAPRHRGRPRPATRRAAHAEHASVSREGCQIFAWFRLAALDLPQLRLSRRRAGAGSRNRAVGIDQHPRGQRGPADQHRVAHVAPVGEASGGWSAATAPAPAWSRSPAAARSRPEVSRTSTQSSPPAAPRACRRGARGRQHDVQRTPGGHRLAILRPGARPRSRAGPRCAPRCPPWPPARPGPGRAATPVRPSRCAAAPPHRRPARRAVNRQLPRPIPQELPIGSPSSSLR